MRRRFQALYLLSIFYFLSSLSCVVLYALRPFPASAIRGQDPKPASEAAREHFVSQETLLRDVTYLASPDCEGRATGTAGNALAREYIKKRMLEAGLLVQEQPFEIKDGKGASLVGVNVLGVLPGANSNAPWLIISAHYDHLGYSKKRGDFYPGADDNAAGVAALFELAKYFKQHQTTHTLLFAAFDAEELGLFGASHFVRENKIVPKENIAFNLNLDMISRSKKQELFAVTNHEATQEPLRKLLFALQPKVGLRLMVSRDDKSLESLASDHLMFKLVGIPFVYLGVADHEDYHQVSDKAQRLDPRFYTAVVDASVLLVQELDIYLPMVPTPKSQPTEQ